MNTTTEEKKATKDLVDLCRVYLLDNFHKFTDANKIKIALALITKSIPQEISGDITHTVFFENIVSKTIPNRLESYVSQN